MKKHVTKSKMPIPQLTGDILEFPPKSGGRTAARERSAMSRVVAGTPAESSARGSGGIATTVPSGFTTSSTTMATSFMAWKMST